MNSKKTITICSSASFYKQVLEVAQDLKKLRYKVKYPLTANIMKRTGIYDPSHYKTWFKDSAKYKRKTYLMLGHYDKIAKSDAILVLNLEKNSNPGYIGGNVLMEMGLALYLKKPIFLYQEPDPQSPFLEEIIGMNPVIINSDLSKVKL